jgi:hypothetical protein
VRKLLDARTVLVPYVLYIRTSEGKQPVHRTSCLDFC